MRKFGVGLLSAILILSPGMAGAQDFSMPGTSPMDLAPQSQALTSSVIGNLSVERAARSGNARTPGRNAQSGGGAGGALSFAPGGRVSDARLPFATSPTTQQRALSEYLGRARAKNPRVAAEASKALAGINIHQRFADAVRPYGLRADDTADVMTAFLLAGWEIMNGREPSNPEIRGVRRQVAGQLTGVPQLRSPAVRTSFGEELKIQFFVIGSGYASAKKEGSVPQYKQGVSKVYRSITGKDIGSWSLTPAGFARG